MYNVFLLNLEPDKKTKWLSKATDFVFCYVLHCHWLNVYIISKTVASGGISIPAVTFLFAGLYLKKICFNLCYLYFHYMTYVQKM